MAHDVHFPLWEYIQTVSEGRTVSLSDLLRQDAMVLNSTFWFHHFNADGQNREGLFQLLRGRIEPHIESNGEQAGYDYYWTLFNFKTCIVSEWVCWGAEPHFYVVGDDR